MAKAPALSTQLKAAQARIAELEKKLSDTESRLTSARESSDRRDKEIEQIHQVLDAVPNPIARKSDAEDTWSRIERTAITRLAAWLAIRTN